MDDELTGQIAEQIVENHDINRKTIGLDIGLEEIVTATLQNLVDHRIPDIEEELEKHQGKKFITFGRLKELEEIQESL